MADKLMFVALDYNSQRENIDFARKLTDGIDSDRLGFKINLDSVADFSADALNPHSMVKAIKDFGRPVFVDLKMWNGGRTMENIAKGCIDLGVEIINMYPHAGGKFMGRIVKKTKGTTTKLFGLTVLTHYTDTDTQRLYGKNLSDSTRMLAEMNVEYGAEGIVVPGNQLYVVANFGIEKLCPAVRPHWYADTKDNDQEQTVTPADAFKNGAKYIVVGSPIRKSPNPVIAAKKILEEMF